MTTDNYGADEQWPDCPARTNGWRCSLLTGHEGSHEWEHDQ